MSPRGGSTVVSAHTELVRHEEGQTNLVTTKLPMIEAVQAFLHHLRNESRNASASAAMARARDARAEASELALAISRRDVIADGEAEMATDFLCGRISEVIGGLPARVTRELRDRRRIEEVLRAAQGGIAADLAADT